MSVALRLMVAITRSPTVGMYYLVSWAGRSDEEAYATRIVFDPDCILLVVGAKMACDCRDDGVWWDVSEAGT
jgi:hypothetical protein